MNFGDFLFINLEIMKQNQLIIVAAAFALIFLGLVWYAAPSSPGAPAKVDSGREVALTAEEPTSYDFGSISMAKGIVSHVFQMKNSGTEPILIKKIYTSCMCTEAVFIGADGKQFGPFGMPGHGGTAGILAKTIRPGETFAVKALFDPAAHGPAGIGPIERIVYLETSRGTKELEIKALVQP